MKRKDKRSYGIATFLCYVIQKIDAQYYEKGNGSRSHKYVYRKFIYPLFGISYHSFIKYIHLQLPPDVLSGLEDFLHKYPELKNILFPQNQPPTKYWT